MATMAHGHSKAGRTLVLLIFVTTTLGCTTLQPISGTDRATLSDQISIGDKIEVTQTDSEVIRFKVDEILDSGIGGDGKFIAYRDIRQIRASRVDGRRAGLAVLQIVGVTTLIVLLIIAIEGVPAGYPAPP